MVPPWSLPAWSSPRASRRVERGLGWCWASHERSRLESRHPEACAPELQSSGEGAALSLRIAAVIPAYQAAPSVGEVVRGTLRFVPEVLVVDDGSTDATVEEARRAGARVISFP